MTTITDFLVSVGFTKESTVPVMCSMFVIIIFVVCAYYRVSEKFSQKVNKAINPIRNAIIEIQTIFTREGIILTHHLLEAPGSPLKPTEYGFQLIKDSGIDKIIEKRKNTFLIYLEKELKKKKSVNPYDVQEIAREVMVSYKDNKIMEPIKNYAFENGMDVERILKLGGLILRDEYLKKHKIKQKP